MAKNLKLHIKNVQIAGAINLNSLKAKLSKKKEGDEPLVEATPIVEEVSKEPEKKKRVAKSKAEESSLSSDVKSETQESAAISKTSEKKSAAETSISQDETHEVKPKRDSKIEAKQEGKEESVKHLKTASKSFKDSDVEVPAIKDTAHAATSLSEEKPKLGPVFREPVAKELAKPAAAVQQPTYKSLPPKEAPSKDALSRPGNTSAQSTRPQTPANAPTSSGSAPTTKPVQRPYQPPASRPVGSWRSVAPQRFTPPPPKPAGPPAPRLGPVERQPLPPKEPSAATPVATPPPRPAGPPSLGGFVMGSGSPTPQSGGYGGQRYGNDTRRPSQPFGRQPPRPQQAPPQAKPDARAMPEKKEFTNKEIEESLFRRSKVKPKETPGTKPLRKIDTKEFENRIRLGLRGDEEEDGWRKRRPSKNMRHHEEQEIVRPTKISVRIPISVKDLAIEMKLKASQLVAKLFLQGKILTLNDMLEDELVIQLLGHDFGCEIEIDTKEEERIRITDKTLQDEIQASAPSELVIRPPVVTFMGHVDHGKTSLIDAIRKVNTAQHEVGAITQHIGAFRVSTPQGDIAVLDTPGHEAFSHMRERGAEVTDIVVLVIAGDEGIKMQTEEALNQAMASKATIVVALNKCDKPAFNAENVYRQLAERNLLPEAWGGQTITVNTSAVTGEGIPQLLEMLALQAEVLELTANPNSRARGTVIESEVEKGMGPVATVLVQNGTLKVGDSLVFGFNWAKVKTMKDEKGHDVIEAGPSTPVRINGLSGLPDSGEEFIVVKSEREAREISQVRHEGKRTTTFHAKRRGSLESMIEQVQEGAPKKMLNLIIRADVQGSCEALKNALRKIESKKVEANILSSGVGMISESDVQLALASKAIIIGFHTQMESHVESEVKELGVQVRMHDIIYHAIDDVRAMMLALLDKIVQEKDVGKAEVKATFKSSQLGIIAGCQVLDGTIIRNNQMRVIRDGKLIHKGSIGSLKRHKDDVREVTKGAECGILLQGFSDYQVGDILEAFEIIYLTQEL